MTHVKMSVGTRSLLLLLCEAVRCVARGEAVRCVARGEAVRCVARGEVARYVARVARLPLSF